MDYFLGDGLLWLFFIYSFLGWVLETVAATLKQRKFANRGLVSGPLCAIHGITAVFMTIGLKDLTGFWLFFFAVIYATVVEWIAGHLIERMYHQRWWDYSDIKWNLDGYICLPISLLKGAAGYLIVGFGNDIFYKFFTLLPEFLIHIILLILIITLVLDVTASYILMTGKSRKLKEWQSANNRIAGVTIKLGNCIADYVEKRIQKAYPKARKVEKPLKDKSLFAQNCDFYKVVLLFFIGAFLGDITETVFCRLALGNWMSRSSVVWGHFSIVWGLAIALVTKMLYKYKDRKESFLFWTGTFLGGAYEYLCSIFTEVVFGKVFWDYSGMPFNLGGRINLLFCFFWGISAVIWFKHIYPVVSGLIEKIPVKPGKIITWTLIVFMSLNIVITSMALIRYDQRGKNIAASEKWQVWIDNHYDDKKMVKIYPKAKEVSK